MWFPQIHASPVLDVPVLPLSGRVSPQLLFSERGCSGKGWGRRLEQAEELAGNLLLPKSLVQLPEEINKLVTR